MTPPEVRLWRRLQLREPGAPRWRRQHPMGPWVLDFYCPDAKLVVEVDGWGHNMGAHPARDERRDAWLAGHGLTVVRVTAAEVMADADGVADGLIRQAAALGQPPPSRR
jgi:very-short-patch-repair endonuclease